MDKKDTILKRYGDTPAFCCRPSHFYDAGTMSKYEKAVWTGAGLPMIRQGKVAVVSMAGGSGRRLNSRTPKGTVRFGLPEQETLFHLQCEMLKQLSYQVEKIIPWYIMTSRENHTQTVQFFEEHDFLGYPKHDVHFFRQGFNRITKQNGGESVRFCPNGTGGVFQAIEEENVLSLLKAYGVKWVFLCGIDNCLIKMADPLLIGLLTYTNTNVAVKYFQGQYENGQLELRNDLFSAVFTVEAIEKIVKEKLPDYKIPYEETLYATESYAADSLSFFPEDITVIKVEQEDEYMPIIENKGQYTPKNAIDAYIRRRNKLYQPQNLFDMTFREDTIQIVESVCGGKPEADVLHAHDFMEIVYFEKGNVTHLCNGNRVSMQENDLLVLPKGIVHGMMPGTKDALWKNCIFEASVLDPQLGNCCTLKQLFNLDFLRDIPLSFDLTSDFLHITDTKNEFFPLFNVMFKEYLQKGPASQQILLHLLRALLVKIASVRPFTMKANTMLTREFLIDLVNTHFYECGSFDMFHLSDVAEKANVSPRYFSRTFKEKVGISFNDYCQERRLERAASQLKSTDMNVLQIMNYCGYNDSKHFYNLFEKKYGMTPAKYRKKYKAGEW